MQTLGIGILGYGFMGKTHAYAYQTMPFYYDPPPAKHRLVAVCTRRESTARAAAETAGFERWTTDPLSVINDPKVDVVHICTPNDQHSPALKAAMAAGKHIYVDKPVVASLAEADELAGLLEGYRGKAQVALQYRCFPATMHAKTLMQEGFVGPITQFRAAYLHSGSVDPSRPLNWKATASAGGGVIRDLGSHVLDLLEWLTGPMTAVNCISRIWAPRRPGGKPGQSVEVDVEDAAVMLLRHSGGAIGTLEASKIATGSEDEIRFEIHGQHGAIRFNLMRPDFLEVFDNRLPDGRHGWQSVATVGRYPAPGGKFPSPKNTVGWLRAHVHCLYTFLSAIANDTPTSPSLSDGIRLQRVLEKARASADAGGTWVNL